MVGPHLSVFTAKKADNRRSKKLSRIKQLSEIVCWTQRVNWRERGWWNNENGLLTPGVLIAPFLRTTIFLISARV